MTTPADQAIQSGARHVDETQHLASGLSEANDVSAVEVNPENATEQSDLRTAVGDMTLSMFVQGASTRVRVGNAHNSAELYEHAFESADEANTALLDAGVLQSDQIPDITQPAGIGIHLANVTVQQLEAAGLKRHGSSTL